MELSENKRILVESLATIIGIVCICTVLGAALFMQFVYHEIPCPLCLLQRVAFVNMGIALLLNLRYDCCVSNWALVILSGATGIAVSIRQILLHVNDPVGYGSAIFGLHMYTWCFMGFAIAIVGSAVLLVFYPIFHK